MYNNAEYKIFSSVTNIRLVHNISVYTQSSNKYGQLCCVMRNFTLQQTKGNKVKRKGTTPRTLSEFSLVASSNDTKDGVDCFICVNYCLFIEREA